MTELDTLRRALRADGRPGAHTLDADLDIGVIMKRGRRVRTRRRIAAVGGAACAAALVFGVVTSVTHVAGSSVTPARPPADSGHVLPPARQPTASPTRAVTSGPVPSPAPRRPAATAVTAAPPVTAVPRVTAVPPGTAAPTPSPSTGPTRGAPSSWVSPTGAPSPASPTAMSSTSPAGSGPTPLATVTPLASN